MAWPRSRFRVEDLEINAPRNLVVPSRRYALQSGAYEAEERLAIRHIRTDLPVLEIGAGIGVVSCALNRRLAAPKAHVAVEMDARLLPVLARNRDVNRCDFEIVHAALWYGQGPARNGVGPFGEAKAGTGTDTVPAATIGELANARGWNQFNLVLDAEGMEHAMLDHEWPKLGSRVQCLVVEMHSGPGDERRCGEGLDRLARAGFREHWVYGANHVFLRGPA